MAEVQTHTLAGEITQVFVEFVMQHAQQAALYLGQIPDPRSGQAGINLPVAKMFIDQLIVVRHRTGANLAPDEKKVIDSAVEELGLAYEEISQLVRARNVGGEPPPELLAIDGPSSAAAPAPLPAPAAATPPPPAPAPVPEAKPPEPEPEISRKRFTKSYGS